MNLLGKTKRRHYVWVLEYPQGSSVTRKMLRNKIMKQLPFQLQTSLSDKVKLIESFDVLSIAEWNESMVSIRLVGWKKRVKDGVDYC